MDGQMSLMCPETNIAKLLRQEAKFEEQALAELRDAPCTS